MAELLFEIGTEELPARFVVPALDDIERVFTEQAAAIGVKHGAVQKLGTPRRLALYVKDVVEKTDDAIKEVLGPSSKAPEKAVEKFAESIGLKPEQLVKITNAKGEYWGAKVEEKGKRAIELLPDVLNKVVRSINFAKSMRWGDVEQSFGRPLHWVVALLGTEVVPVVFADVKSGRQTKGHRFLANQWLEIQKPADYEAMLEKAHVIADVSKRRKLLVDAVEAAAKKAGGTVIPDEGLFDQVVNLVELPCPVIGSFDAKHLDLPPEVLIQEMKSHQRYFSLQGADGKLLPKFIAVSNTPVKNEALSLAGYERVLKARLSDGRFFFDEDRLKKLDERLPRLERVVWQGQLGTQAERVARFRTLALWLSKAIGKGDPQTIDRAATLSKADLVTGMVGEFPELQGVMGREYALHQGEPKAVALAIFEHYLPRGATDAMPTADEGAMIGLADRFDSVCGIFGIGKKPTGANDPFALRRSAIAILNITLAKSYRYSLSGAIDEALKGVEPKLKDVKKKQGEAPVREQVLEFFKARLESLWESHRKDVVAAVLAAGFDDVVAASKRVTALSARVKGPEFAPLAATFKRVGNIIAKQAKDVAKAPVDEGKLVDAPEKALHQKLIEVRAKAEPALKADDYAAALDALTTLKPHVDLFFDKVMVMAEDKALRENRVRLLMEIGGLFERLADFTQIQAD